jgi:hypothetical protein
VAPEPAEPAVLTGPGPSLAAAEPALLPLDEVMARADLPVIGAPRPEYRGVVTREPVADIWNLLGRGVLA